jgi:hypothetical protein
MPLIQIFPNCQNQIPFMNFVINSFTLISPLESLDLIFLSAPATNNLLMIFYFSLSPSSFHLKSQENFKFAEEKSMNIVLCVFS